MSYPRISIVTPNLNKVKYLENTILSVLSQNYPNLEYIIIDGGSTDGSVDIIKKYADKLAYWVSEPDNGMYDAIRKGFEHSTGGIMAWIGSDDMYHAHSFYTVAEIFSKWPEISWLVGAGTHYDATGKTVRTARSRYFNHLDFLTHRYKWIQQESTFWRRSIYEKVGVINEAFKLAGDFDLWMRFSRYEKMYITDALIGGFRISDNQLSKDKERYCKEADAIIANEPVSDKELNQVKAMRRVRKFISLLKKMRVFNSEALERLLVRQYYHEERSHRITYDFNSKSFVMP